MDCTFKILVVGDSGVGKTTAIRRFVGRPFPTKVVPTVAYQFYSRSIEIAEKQIRLHFWDISGQKSKMTLGMSYLGQADAVVVFYDLNNFATFHYANQWIDSITQKKQLPIFLFGNKLDLCFKGQGRQVNGEQIELMKKLDGVSKIGSGLVDSSFEKGLLELVQSNKGVIQGIQCWTLLQKGNKIQMFVAVNEKFLYSLSRQLNLASAYLIQGIRLFDQKSKLFNGLQEQYDQNYYPIQSQFNKQNSIQKYQVQFQRQSVLLLLRQFFAIEAQCFYLGHSKYNQFISIRIQFRKVIQQPILLFGLFKVRSQAFYNILIIRQMGTIQSKIREGYNLAQKPCLKKKHQKSLSPSLDFHEKSHIYRKNSAVQNVQVAQLTNMDTHPISLTQAPSFESLDERTTDSELSQSCKSYPATAIGFVQSRFEESILESVLYGAGSLIGSNIVLTTAHQLFSLKNKSQATSIKFYLNDGSNQEQFEVEKTFFSQNYKNLDLNDQTNRDQISMEDYGVIILKSNVSIQKYGLLGFDFNQKSEDKPMDIALYGFNQRKDSLKIQAISTKAKLEECTIKYHSLFNLSFSGGPIISCQDNSFTIIGIQNQDHRHRRHSFEKQSLRLHQKMYTSICQWVTKEEEEIDLRNKELGKQGVKKLVKLEKTSLSSINISKNNIGPSGLKYLTRCEWNHLHHLDIGGNEIRKQGVMHLIKIQMKNLLSLNMYGNSIGSQGAALLLEADWKNLNSINLYNNGICNQGVKILIKANWEQLQSINLGKNNISSAILSLFQYAVWKNIVSINLWANLIKDCNITQNEIKKYFVKIKYLYL